MCLCVCVCVCVRERERERERERVFGEEVKLSSQVNFSPSAIFELTVKTIFDSSSLAMMSCLDSHATSQGVCPATLCTNKGAPLASNSCKSIVHTW